MCHFGAQISERNHKETIYDAAPVIGDFKYDPEMAKLIHEKEELALSYYKAKQAGNAELAKSLLSDVRSFNTQTSSNSINSSSDTTIAASAPAPASSNRIGILQNPQQKGNYCGYAAIQSLLEYKGINKTQDTIAKDVYNTSTGCPWYLSNGNSWDQFPAPKYLTDKTGFYYVPYPYGVVGATNVTASDIKPKIIVTIDSNYGVLTCGNSKGHKTNDPSILPGYPAYDIGHWLAIDGYYSNGDYIWIVDPAKSSVISWSGSIEKYYSISATKLAAFTTSKGIVW